MFPSGASWRTMICYNFTRYRSSESYRFVSIFCFFYRYRNSKRKIQVDLHSSDNLYWIVSVVFCECGIARIFKSLCYYLFLMFKKMIFKLSKLYSTDWNQRCVIAVVQIMKDLWIYNATYFCSVYDAHIRKVYYYDYRAKICIE